MPDFSMQTLKAGRAWMDVPQALGDHRWSQPAKLSLTIDQETKPFYDKIKFKQLLTIPKSLEGKLHSEEVNHTQEDTRNK